MGNINTKIYVGNNNTTKEHVYIPIESVSIKEDNTQTSIGLMEIKKLKVKKTPYDGTIVSQSWTSSNPYVCMVTHNGEIIGLKKGNCHITYICNGIVSKQRVIVTDKINNYCGYIDENRNLVFYKEIKNIENYRFVYKNQNNYRVKNFIEFSYDELNSLIKENVAPYSAFYIEIINKFDESIGYIDIVSHFKPKYDERLYRVGLMSDTHYNDHDWDFDPSTYEDDGSEYSKDFINALKFYEDKESVEFVCVAGDVSTDNINHVCNFRLQRDSYSPNTSIYTCKGNHDNAAAWDNNDLWLKYTTEYNDDKTKIFCPYGDKTSFYFVRHNKFGKDIFIFLNVDYNSNGTGASGNNTDDNVEDIDRTHQYYNPETLGWFEEILEKYKHNRCFVFTHLFFRQKAGNNHGEYYQYYTNGRSRKYSLRGIQFIKLNELNNKYKNSIWFTGHSHYPWYWQKYDPIINVCNYDYNFIEGSGDNGVEIGNIKMLDKKCQSAYNIHLPSLARPLNLSWGYDVDLKRSEGAIIDIYENYVDLRGITFKTKDDYIIEEQDYIQITNDFISPDYERSYYNENQRSEQLENGYVKLIFTDYQIFYIGNENYYPNNTSVKLEIEDIKVYDSEGNDLTNIMRNGYFFGFRTSRWADPYELGKDYVMYFTEENDFYNDTNIDITKSNGIMFGCSTAYKDIKDESIYQPKFKEGYEIYCEIKAKISFTSDKNIKLNYPNKYNGIGTYRIPVGGKNIVSID